MFIQKSCIYHVISYIYIQNAKYSSSQDTLIMCNYISKQLTESLGSHSVFISCILSLLNCRCKIEYVLYQLLRRLFATIYIDPKVKQQDEQRVR